MHTLQCLQSSFLLTKVVTKCISTSLVPRSTPFFVLQFALYYIERKPKNKKRGRPGNEANINFDITKRADKSSLLTSYRLL